MCLRQNDHVRSFLNWGVGNALLYTQPERLMMLKAVDTGELPYSRDSARNVWSPPSPGNPTSWVSRHGRAVPSAGTEPLWCSTPGNLPNPAPPCWPLHLGKDYSTNLYRQGGSNNPEAYLPYDTEVYRTFCRELYISDACPKMHIMSNGTSRLYSLD